MFEVKFVETFRILKNKFVQHEFSNKSYSWVFRVDWQEAKLWPEIMKNVFKCHKPFRSSVDVLSALNVVSDDKQSLSWVKRLAELNDALEVEVEYISVLDIEVALTEGVLITFDHHKDNFLIGLGAFEEVLQESLFLDFFFGFLHILQLFQQVLFVIIVILFLLLLLLNSHGALLIGLWLPLAAACVLS